MTMRYHNQHYSLFALIGSLYKEHNLPLAVRQKLGFLHLAAIDDRINMLVKDAYCNECGVSKEKLSSDEMLDDLRFMHNGRFANYTRNQVIVQLIEEEFNIVNQKIEQEITDEHIQRSFKQLLSNTNYLERRKILPDGE